MFLIPEEWNCHEHRQNLALFSDSRELSTVVYITWRGRAAQSRASVTEFKNLWSCTSLSIRLVVDNYRSVGIFCWHSNLCCVIILGTGCRKGNCNTVIVFCGILSIVLSDSRLNPTPSPATQDKLQMVIVKFSVDLGSGLRWEKVTVACSLPATDVFRL